LRPAQIRALRTRLQVLIRDAGQTDLSSDRGTAAHLPFWQLEPTPLVLEATDWALLESALAQRARVVNAFLSDIYHNQEILKAKVLPPEVVLTDPYYRRPCLNLDPKRESPATLLRFDLVKTTEGWCFADTRANTPVGLSYAVQNRRFLTQEMGGLYGSLPEYHSIINFPLQLLDVLHQLSPRPPEKTSMVVLTSGPRDPFFSEHSFLARKMGLPLARGDDLLVLDNCVYFKTIAGLERVDVIYRRLNDAHIDPVVFSTDRESVGIPGLLQCIRSGNVVVANAIGCGLAENRSLEAYWPRLLRFYLGEKALLPSLPTCSCGDNDQLESILDSSGDWRIRPIHDPKLGDLLSETPQNPLLGPGGLSRAVLENPYHFVAQKNVVFAPLETAAPGRAPGFVFSAFVLSHARRASVLPGGLVRLGSDDTPIDRVGVTADAIVLQGTTGGVRDSADREAPVVGTPHGALGSRAAENLFWLGRYLERAEATARMQSIFDDVALEEIPARDRRRWSPVWRGLLEATGHGAEKITARANPQTALSTDLAWRMALDGSHPSSIFSSVNAACENARQLRDYVSPEAWTILNRLQTKLAGLRRAESLARPKVESARALAHAEDNRRKNAQIAIQFALTDLNAFLGTAERTMLQDAGWQFLRMGLHLERATMTCSSLRHILGALDAAASLPPLTSGPNQPRDNPELSALLRMLGSQDAYRRLYQTRSEPRLVAQLFLQQPDAPRSIFHNLHQIKTSLRAIQLDLREEEEPSSIAVGETLQFLASLRVEQHFANAPKPTDEKTEKLAALLSELLDRLYRLHSIVSDHYFSHQARLASVANQVELKL
jgi:uncharacterized circularly permuted ATP-grasp superfamily protein/uncharacterized alpha-E superfamily protein